MIEIGMVLSMTFMGAAASIFFKRASGSEGFIKMFLNVHLYIGGILYLAAAAVNILVLRYLDYSVVLPVSSITYIWTMLLSYIIAAAPINVIDKTIPISIILHLLPQSVLHRML